MEENKDSANHCTYRIVYATTLEDLEKQVNELIAQGWDAESIAGGGWELIGEIHFDGKNYYREMMNCPLQKATAAKASSPNQF